MNILAVMSYQTTPWEELAKKPSIRKCHSILLDITRVTQFWQETNISCQFCVTSDGAHSVILLAHVALTAAGDHVFIWEIPMSVFTMTC